MIKVSMKSYTVEKMLMDTTFALLWTFDDSKYSLIHYGTEEWYIVKTTYPYMFSSAEEYGSFGDAIQAIPQGAMLDLTLGSGLLAHEFLEFSFSVRQNFMSQIRSVSERYVDDEEYSKNLQYKISVLHEWLPTKDAVALWIIVGNKGYLLRETDKISRNRIVFSDDLKAYVALKNGHVCIGYTWDNLEDEGIIEEKS